MQWHPNPNERRAYASLKWSTFPDAELPLWVADMDCAPPPCVRDTINRSLEHGIFGYGKEPKGFREAWVDHLHKTHQWTIDPDWIVPVAGVVPGMRFALMAHLQIQQILTPTPAYSYFKTVPSIEKRIEHPMALTRVGETLEPSLTQIAETLETLTEPSAILWCNPHNPGGTVYSKQFLEALIATASKHDTLIVSDEIWADLILNDKPHIPLGLVASNDQPTITLMAATKTFNVAGFGCAVAIIPEPNTRARYLETQIAMPHVAPLAYAVTQSCLRDGWQWHRELLAALQHNRNTVIDWAKSHPELEVTTGDATFLAWIESHNQIDLSERFAAQGVRLSPGGPFGSDTAVRLNFGTNPATLNEALRRMDAALLSNREEHS
jgi:cystathionine beta-lyase